MKTFFSLVAFIVFSFAINEKILAQNLTPTQVPTSSAAAIEYKPDIRFMDEHVIDFQVVNILDQLAPDELKKYLLKTLLRHRYPPQALRQ